MHKTLIYVGTPLLCCDIMDKVQYSNRESSLKYLIGIFENEYTWLNSVKLNAQKAMASTNATHMMALGEALSAKRKGTLLEYFENWYRAFKDYEAEILKNRPMSTAAVRRVFRRTPTKPVTPAANYDQQQQPEVVHEVHSHEPPFPLDARIVFLCLCQTVLVMYEAISELSVREWSKEEKDLYNKLDHKIKNLIIDPGLRSLDNEARSVINEDRKLLRFLR